MKKWIERTIFIVALCVFCFSAYKLYTIFSEYNKGSSEYDKLEKYKRNDSSKEEARENTGDSGTNVDFEELRKINNDIVAWVEIKGTNINYPVVKGKDNDYYISHTFEKNSNSSGAIFLECNNEGDFSDGNSILYGHNMKNQKMFHDLSKYTKKEFYDEHSEIILYTPGETKKYKIFSFYVADARSDTYKTSFSDKEDFKSYIGYINGKSQYNTGEDANEDNKIITLSTCTNGNVDDRYVIHGKLMP